MSKVICPEPGSQVTIGSTTVPAIPVSAASPLNYPSIPEDLRRQIREDRRELVEALREIADGPQPLSDYLNGIRCGVEDRCLQGDVYGAAEYAYEQGIEWCADIARSILTREGGKS